MAPSNQSESLSASDLDSYTLKWLLTLRARPATDQWHLTASSSRIKRHTFTGCLEVWKHSAWGHIATHISSLESGQLSVYITEFMAKTANCMEKRGRSALAEGEGRVLRKFVWRHNGHLELCAVSCGKKGCLLQQDS